MSDLFNYGVISKSPQLNFASDLLVKRLDDTC